MDRPLYRVKSTALIMLTLAAIGACKAWAEPNDALPKLQDRALSVLQTVMKEGKSFEKVHAAEALISSGHPQGVQQFFLEQQRAHGSSPQIRIGIWRVLYRTYEGNAAAQEEYVRKIVAVFSEPKATEQSIAAETLAKINYAARTTLVQDLAERGKDDVRVSARWILANSGRVEDEAYLAELLASKNPADRFYAAYALRHLKAIQPTTMRALQGLAAREPADGQVKYFVLGTLYCHLPKGQREPIGSELLKYAASGKTDQRYQACMALANWPTEEMIPVAEKLLGSKSPDERVGGAYVLLRMGKPHVTPPMHATDACDVH